MFSIGQEYIVLMALVALVAAALVQHLCHSRGFGTGLRFSGWALGVGLFVVVPLATRDPYTGACLTLDEESTCSRLEFMRTQAFLVLSLAGSLLVVWSVLYATALAACWLVYRLVVPRRVS